MCIGCIHFKLGSPLSFSKVFNRTSRGIAFQVSDTFWGMVLSSCATYVSIGVSFFGSPPSFSEEKLKNALP